MVFGLQEAGNLIAKLLQTQVIERHAHNREMFREQFRLGQVEERGDQLALGQVARSPEEYQHARPGGPADLLMLFLPV